MQGLHLTADLRDCAATAAVMTDTAALRHTCLAAVDEAGLHAVGELFHRFVPTPDQVGTASGITGVVLLAESHLAVHTWPELFSVTLDVYVCNLGTADNAHRAHALMEALIAAFAPGRAERQAHRRG